MNIPLRTFVASISKKVSVTFPIVSNAIAVPMNTIFVDVVAVVAVVARGAGAGVTTIKVPRQ